jgi:putative transposase
MTGSAKPITFSYTCAVTNYRREGFAQHADYIHFNPVKHGHVSRVRDWPYSSFHRMVRFGVYPLDWAGDAADDRSSFGER